MHDQNFMRTVVLLVEHNDGGSIGFILNRQLKTPLSELSDQLTNFHFPAYLGGPVEQNTLHYVHRLGDRLQGSQQIGEDLYWGGDFESLYGLLLRGEVEEEDIRFFVGYSGWGGGQLDREMEQDAWIVAPENSDFVFEESEDPQNLWQRILKSMGTKYQVISNYPIDPRLN